jgi:hypothetical protein
VMSILYLEYSLDHFQLWKGLRPGPSCLFCVYVKFRSFV